MHIIAGDVEIGITDTATAPDINTTDIAGEATTVAYIAISNERGYKTRLNAAFFISPVLTMETKSHHV